MKTFERYRRDLEEMMKILNILQMEQGRLSYQFS